MADHINIRKANGTWVIRAKGAVIGESSEALELSEGDYTPVIYFPRDALAMALFDKTDSTSHCPWKGDATYYTLQAKSGPIVDAAWSYENPKPEMARITNHLAFYPDKVTVEKL